MLFRSTTDQSTAQIIERMNVFQWNLFRVRTASAGLSTTGTTATSAVDSRLFMHLFSDAVHITYVRARGWILIYALADQGSQLELIK